MRAKQIITLLLCVAWSAAVQAASTPSWVTQRPTSEDCYIGISRVALSEADCRAKAAKLALDEIAAQICVNTESESFMRMVVVDGRSNELFENKISQSISVELEGQKIKDSYESATHYYLYYELNKESYYKSVAAKRDTATKNGLDLYNKATEAEAQGNLLSAVQLYAKGLEVIEPYLYLSLVATRNGADFNVANELYSGYLNVLSGLVITTNLRELSVEAFKPNQYPIAACISKNNKVLKNVELEAKFTSGSGSVTPAVMSDVNGTALFYVTNITSKQPVQSISIGLGDSFTKSIPPLYRDLISTVALPSATITLALASSNYTAYFDVDQNDIEACEAQVKMLLANNNFEFNSNVNSDLYVLYSTTFRSGSTVTGGTFDLNECFCELTVEIYDNKTQSLLLKYNTGEQRILVPSNQTMSQAKMTCARELVKIFKKGLPTELKRLTIVK